MTLPLYRYSLDRTGISPDNLVSGELHTLPSRLVRVIATTYGAFFTDSLQITDSNTNAILTKDVQYYAAELYEIPTAKYGKQICSIVVITDISVSDNVSLRYQALGGDFSNSVTAIVQQIEALQLDNRPIGWGNVIDKPNDYAPSHHLHDLGDVYGFEYLVHAIDRVRAAIEFGDAASHDAIYRYIDSKSQATYINIPFSVSMPLTVSIPAYMPQQYVSSILNFVAAPNPVRHASVYLRLIADGINVPTFANEFKKSTSSGNYLNINGVINKVQFSYDGYDYWYTLSQAVGDVGNSLVVNALTLTGPAGGVSGSASTNFIVTLSPVNGTIGGTIIVTPNSFNGGGTFAPTTLALSSSTRIGTFTYTPYSVGSAVILVTNTGSLTNPSGVPYVSTLTLTAISIAATGPTNGIVGATSSNFTVNVSPLGGAITGTVIVTPHDSGAGGTFVPTSRSLNSANVSGTFTYTASSVGTKTISFTNSGSLGNPTNLTYVVASSINVPDAPTGVSATAGSGKAVVSYTASANNGGSSIITYRAIATPGGLTGTSSPGSGATNITVLGLTNGVQYTFTVRATSAIGNSAESAPSVGVTPILTAGAIVLTGPTFGDIGIASSNFTVNVSPLGGAITGTVIVTPHDSSGGVLGTFVPSNVSLTSASPTKTFTYTPPLVSTGVGVRNIDLTNNGGLVNPALTFVYNAWGSPASAPTVTASVYSNTIAPTLTNISFSDAVWITDFNTAQIRISWTTPTNVGLPAFSRYHLDDPQGVGQDINVATTVNSYIETNIPFDTSSNFSVSGDSDYSYGTIGYSNFVSVAPLKIIGGSDVIVSGTYNRSDYDFTSAAISANGGVTNIGLQSNQDGQFGLQIISVSIANNNSIMIGTTLSNVPVATSGIVHGMRVNASTGKYEVLNAGTWIAATVMVISVELDVIRLRRTGTNLYAEVQRNTVSGYVWTIIYTWTNVSASTKYKFIVQGNNSARAHRPFGINLGQ